MKRQKTKLFQFLSALAVIALLATSCSKKMKPLTSDLFTVNPSPLEMAANKVDATINGRFPAKWFDKKTTLVLTPVLKYQGGEALGKSQTYQGEKVAGNGIVVNQKDGAAMTMQAEFKYVPAMKNSELYLRFEFSKNGKAQKSVPDLKVADGVIATPSLACAATSKPAYAPDKFQRKINEAYDANIMFLIQQASLRKSELKSDELATWKKIVAEADQNDRKNINIEIGAYASPDGGVKLNDRLAQSREKNTEKFLKRDFKKSKIAKPEINANYTAQDWDGFKKLVEASNLQDKDLVLRVLSMYSDPVRREKEIKNISTVYSELAETILPKLRRSRLTANIEIIGKSNEELINAVNSDMSQLNVEELLFTATLKGVTNQEAIYSYVTQKYPEDNRGWNNLGAYYYEHGQMDKAAQYFTKASQVGSNCPEANMNLALLALAKHNTDQAEQFMGNAAGAATFSQTQGLLNIEKGNYTQAVAAYDNTISNNAALAQLLSKDYNKAQQTLNNVAKKDSTTYYLMAVVAARTNNAAGVAQNMKQAIAAGVAPADLANDKEFAKFLTNPDVQQLLPQK